MRAPLAAALLALAAVATSHLGAVHPAADSLAPFRAHAALVALACAAPALLAGTAPRRPAPLLVIVAALASLAAPLRHHLPPAAPSPVVVYQKNLSAALGDVSAVLGDVEATAPDAVLLQELGPAGGGLLRRLGPSHPTQHRCPNPWIASTAVLSRWPALPGTARCAQGAAVIRVRTPAGPLWLVSVHLRWPWPLDQMGQAERLARELSALEAGPAVIGGDMNAAARSRSVGILGDAFGARALPPRGPTYRIGGLVPVAIDHVLATGPGTLERRPPAGSDHRGLLARLDPFAGAAQAPIRAGSKG